MSIKVTCKFCGREGELFHIRGREACLKCQIEFLWDFVEGTRRMVDNIDLGEPVYGPLPEAFTSPDINKYVIDPIDLLPPLGEN